MRAYQDLTGLKFNRLTVIREIGKINGLRYWECLCDCGNTVKVQGAHLRTGHTKSCGCLSKEKKQPKHNLTGMQFGSLKVLEQDMSKKGTYWKCLCTCGREISVDARSLIRGKQISCGCVGEKNRIEACTKHGKARTVSGKRTCKLYSVWDGMKQRCQNPNSSAYKWYGARGIKVCEQWKNNFESFYEWAIKSGYKEGLQIDRIDSNKSYYPENCRWATPKEQAYNKRCFDLREDSVRPIPKIWLKKLKPCSCGETPKMRVGKVMGSNKRYARALCLKCGRSLEVQPVDIPQHRMWKNLINEWNALIEA